MDTLKQRILRGEHQLVLERLQEVSTRMPVYLAYLCMSVFRQCPYSSSLPCVRFLLLTEQVSRMASGAGGAGAEVGDGARGRCVGPVPMEPGHGRRLGVQAAAQRAADQDRGTCRVVVV